MAIYSVNEIPLLINQQIAFQEKIAMCLGRLEALMTAAVRTDGFYELPKTTIHDYFCIVDDLIGDAVKINQESLCKLHQI